MTPDKPEFPAELVSDIDDLIGERAIAGTLPCFSGDGYGYGGSATLTIGNRTFLIGEGSRSHDLAAEIACRWNKALPTPQKDSAK